MMSETAKQNDIFSVRDRKVTLYHFNGDGVFTRTERNKIIKAGMGCPAGSTLIPPPPFNGTQIAVFENGEWILKESFKGVEVYCKKTGESIAVDWVGVIGDDYTTEKPTTDADAWNGEKWVTDVEKLKQNACGDIKAAAEIACRRGLKGVSITSFEYAALSSAYKLWVVDTDRDSTQIPELFSAHNPTATPVNAVIGVEAILNNYESVGNIVHRVSAAAQFEINNTKDLVKIQNVRLKTVGKLNNLFKRSS